MIVMTKLFFLKNFSWKACSFLMFIDFLKITFIPSLDLIYWGFGFIILDLLTGVIKSLVLGDFLVSRGLRQTLVKFAQYIGLLLLMFMISNVVCYDPELSKRFLQAFGSGDIMYEKVVASLRFINNLILLIIIYTEALSISENLIAIDPSSKLSQWVFRPLHKFLSLMILGDPLRKYLLKKFEEKK